MGLMAHATDIVAYDFKADRYCPECINEAVENDTRFDGWQLSPVQGLRPVMPTEDNLNEIATAFGIDRMDETTFDSDDFPKVVFRDNLQGHQERCGACGEMFG